MHPFLLKAARPLKAALQSASSTCLSLTMLGSRIY